MEVDYSQDVRSFFPILKEYVFIPGPVGPIDLCAHVQQTVCLHLVTLRETHIFYKLM